MAQYDVDLRDYWRIIKKRKIIVVLIVLLVGISSYGFAKLQEPPPLYKTNAAIKISASSGLSTVFGSRFVQSESLETHAYLLKSFSVLELAAKEANLIPKELPVEEIRSSQRFMGVINQLKSMIQAVQEVGTNVINIWVTSRNPEEAARIANATAVAYRKYNIQEKNRKTIETRSFIEAQLQKTSDDLKKAESALQRFEEDNALILLNEQTYTPRGDIADRGLAGRLNIVSNDYETIQKEIKEAATLFNILVQSERSDQVILQEASFSSLIGSKSYELTARLRDLIRQRQILLVDFTEIHPQVIAIGKQIEGAIGSTKKEIQAHLDQLREKEADLKIKLDDLKVATRGLPGKNLDLLRFRREVSLHEGLFSQLKSKYQDILIQESGRVEEVSIVRPALIPRYPFNIPSKGRIIFTGIVMGLILGMVAAFGIEVFDTSIGTIEDVENLLQVPVLGVIPFMDKEAEVKGDAQNGVGSGRVRRRDLITHYDPRSLASEAFRYLRTNLRFISVDKKSKSFLITSAFIQEGKTFNSINLALSMAQAGNRVLLIEGDLRKPVIHKNFGLNKSPGVTDYVLGNYDWREIKNSITDVMLGEFELEEILRTPGLDNLNIITAGTTPPNPSEILRSERFAELIKQAYKEYDFILVDSPPVLPVADPSEIAPLVDGVVLIYTVGKIGRGILKRAKLSLDNVQANVLGIVLNNVKPEVGPDYFKYHSKYYYGPEGKSPSEGASDQRSGWQRQTSIVSSAVTQYIVLMLTLAAMAVGIFWHDVSAIISLLKF